MVINIGFCKESGHVCDPNCDDFRVTSLTMDVGSREDYTLGP
jgi:hypothetical protein